MQLFRRSKEGPKDVASEAGRHAVAAANEFSRIVEQGIDQAANALSDVSESGKQATDSARKAATDVRSSLETSVRAQPITALLIAAAVGMAFGALIRPGRE